MKPPVHVPLNWSFINWLPEDTWKRETLRKLIDAGVNHGDINRSVYAIRLNGNYAIHYPNGESPTVYVGEGNFCNRITCHKSWVAEI